MTRTTTGPVIDPTTGTTRGATTGPRAPQFGRGALLGALLLLPGCVMGPRNPTAPVAPPPAPVAESIRPASAEGQDIRPGAPLDLRWWTAFGSPDLDALVTQALAQNQDLAAADAALRQAQQLSAAAGGALAPQIDAGLSSQRTRTSDTMANELHDPSLYLYSLHTAQLAVSYPLDLFGGLRAQHLSARAQAEVAAHRLDAARTMVVANLVTATIQQAAYDAQLRAAADSVANNRDILRMLERRHQLGDIGDADVAAQQAALAAAEGQIPALTRARDHQKTLIAILLGIAPGSPLPPLPPLEALHLPASVPVALPSDLVAARPDVQAAAAQMRGAGADVGAAIAARLPSITLSASAGGMAQNFGDMFASGNPFWSLLGGLTQPIFHGGQLMHRQKAAEAALDAAKATYRLAVLQAFGDVADALSGLRTDGAALDAATRADDAAARNLDYTRTRLRLGGVGTLTLLNASSSAAQASIQRVQARAARLIDTVALYQATGGRIAP